MANCSNGKNSISSNEGGYTLFNKYLHKSFTLLSNFYNCLIALISQGFPTKANGSFNFKAS